MEELDIAEVASRSKVTPSALRFYERRGLVKSAGRNGLRRTFHPDVIDRLVLIRCAQQAGFTLNQIATFLAATPDDDWLRKSLNEQASRLDEEITALVGMRDSLRHAATCTHAPLVDCPEFKTRLRPPTRDQDSQVTGASQTRRGRLQTND